MHFELYISKTIQDGNHVRSGSRIFRKAVECKLQVRLRTPGRPANKLFHLRLVDPEARRVPLEVVVVRKLARADLAQNDPEREHVRREPELVAQQDLGRHVRVGAAEREPLALFGVACSNAREAEVGDLETAIRGDEEVLALEVAVDALSGVEVGEGASDVRREREAEPPGEGFILVVDVESEVTWLER